MTTTAATATDDIVSFAEGPPAGDEAATAPPSWNPAARFAFRFCFIYFGLYALTTQMLTSLLPNPIMDIPSLDALPPLRNIVSWVGTHLLGIHATISHVDTGSGDKMHDWVFVFTLALVAIIGATVWTWRARKSAVTHHDRLYVWFRLFMRLVLATTLVTYGMIKFFPLQMPAPGLMRLVEPFGNFSPMGVLWASIGSAKFYEIFAGSAELLAAVLLFIPRTATIGALVALADSIQVFTLNMTYDVPVKVFSFHLILIALFLLAPNFRRLLDFFVAHQPVRIASEPTPGRTEMRRRKIVTAQLLFGAWVLLFTFVSLGLAWRSNATPARSPLYGIWDIQRMSVDGIEQAAFGSSTTYRRAIFEQPTLMAFQRMDDSLIYYGAKVDTTKHSLTLTKFGKDKVVYPVQYTRPSVNTLIVDGSLNQGTMHIEMVRRDPDSYLLRRRGFHWISEVPFNR